MILIYSIIIVFIIWYLIYNLFINVKPNKYIKELCDIKVVKINGRKVYNVASKNGERKEKVIFYLHGGSYVRGMTNNYWNFVSDLCIDMASQVVVVDYPLAPMSNCKRTIEFIIDIYEKQVEKYGNENMYVMGDSAGGGLAFAFIEYMQKNNKNILPQKIILISPWLDIDVSNPESNKYIKKDKVLNKTRLYLAKLCYKGNIKSDDYRVSPLNGDFSKIGDNRLEVFVGKSEMFYPDCKKLLQIANEKNVKMNLYEYENKQHIWLITEKKRREDSAYKKLLEL